MQWYPLAMEVWSHAAAVVLTTLFAPLLPERYRSRWPWSDLVGLPGVQTLHGVLWAVAGLVFWAWGFILYQQEASDLVVAVLTDERNPGDVGPITHYGLILYFAYLVTPRGFLLTFLLLDGAVRGVAGAMSGVVPGNFYVWMLLSAGRWAGELASEARRTARYGRPEEPDEVVQEGGLLRVRRTRPHPEWNADQAFRFGEKFFCLHNYDPEARKGDKLCVEYTFTPWPEGRTLRRVVNLPTPLPPPPDDADGPDVSPGS
jgi:hypothetical protein